MRKLSIMLAAALLGLAGTLCGAQERRDTSMSDFRPRFVVEVEKSLVKNKLSISLEEEARLMSNCTRFDKLYSTLTLSYAPCKWFKLAPEYSLIANYGSKNDWSLRHRVALNLTGKLPVGQWEFSLRERPQVSIRTDSLNVHEKLKAAFVLRSRAQVQYSFFNVPLKLYAFVEMTNTLNTPETFTGLTGKDSGEITFKLKNHISKMRYSVGAQYRFDKNNYLELYYRLDDGVDYDIHITRNKGYLRDITKESYVNHILGVAYKYRF